MGFAVLGDSISAHFHIPEEWLGKFSLFVHKLTNENIHLIMNRCY